MLLVAVGLVAVAAALETAALLRGEAWRPLGSLDPMTVVGGLAVLLAVAAGIDRLGLRRLPAPQVVRVLPRSLALEAWCDVGLELRHAAALGGGARLVDGFPRPAEVEALPIPLSGGAEGRERVRYRIRPLARGDVCFEQPSLSASSPWGLWRYVARVGVAERHRVLPNFAAMARFDALLSEARIREVGIKRHQRRGEGLEFHELREYRPGDPIRRIDWKATARKRALIAREYEQERDQRLVFLLDCSRRMRAKDDELSHFDHCLNAMILLSHVALRGGDAVGLMSLGEERRWLSPSKGTATMSRLLRTVYDLEPTTLGIDFRGAAEELCRRQRRRAMVIVLTHLQEEDLEDLLPAVRLLRRTHYVQVVDLRQAELDGLLANDPATVADAFATMGAWRHDLERRRVHERLRSAGLRPLDVRPDQLGSAIVNRYYEVKQGGQL
ncbi:MAG: DUF58 domain-containing protein [Myxococcota bacterium]